MLRKKAFQSVNTEGGPYGLYDPGSNCDPGGSGGPWELWGGATSISDGILYSHNSM